MARSTAAAFAVLRCFLRTPPSEVGAPVGVFAAMNQTPPRRTNQIAAKTAVGQALRLMVMRLPFLGTVGRQ